MAEETFDDIVSGWNCNPETPLHDNETMSAYVFPGTACCATNMFYQESLIPNLPDLELSTGDQMLAPNVMDSHGVPEHLTNKPNHTCIFMPPKSVHECMKNLSKLSLDLYEHAIIIPPLSTQHSSSSIDVLRDSSTEVAVAVEVMQTDILESRETQETQEFPIDDTFHLSTALLDIVCYLNELHTGSRNTPARTAKVSLNRRCQPNEVKDRGELIETRGDTWQGLCESAVDDSTMILVISCYTRLMDIYECLFGHIKACVERAILPRNRAGHFVSLPAVRAGSYQMPTSSTVPLQIMTLLQLSSSVGNSMKTLLDGLKHRQWVLEDIWWI
jgi:hypothetical protein